MGEVGQRMIFVIGAPRSGTTLLMRMLNAHSDVYTRPEPHLLTPLAGLGFYDHVEKASYDPLQAALSAKQFVGDLPNGEADYLDALRAYTDILYGRMLDASGKRVFVDKTPAYALILPFLVKLYPEAKFVVLTRHPFAIFSSFAKSFFDNDWAVAHDHNPLLERYVPALARFLREAPVPHLHLRYEALVSDPEAHVQDLCAYTGLPFEPGMVDYGDTAMASAGLGDPIGVDKHTRPNTASLDTWAMQVKDHPERIALLEQCLERIFDEDLETLGYTRESLWEPLERVDGEKAKAVRGAAKKWDRYHVERRVLVKLRRNIHANALGKLVRSARFYSDVLLRDTYRDDPEEKP